MRSHIGRWWSQPVSLSGIRAMVEVPATSVRMAPVRKRRAKSRGLNNMGFPSVATTSERITAAGPDPGIAERR
ncbi:hypothetical protein D3C73_1406790 [compost metagenome]